MPENANTVKVLVRFLPLILGLLIVMALGAGAVAVQAGARSTPPAELSEEELLSRMTSAPENAPGFQATVEVEQALVPEGLIGATEGDGGPDSGLRTARIWSDGPEKLRAELQGENGDKVIVRNGPEVSVYDGATNTLKTGEKPEESTATPEEKAASPEDINELLADISPTSNLQTGPPVQVARRWAYPLTLEPKDKDSTLVERAEAYVDAEAFVPLALDLYAKGDREPVIHYEAKNFVVGSQPEERFAFEAPPGAQVEALEPRDEPGAAEENRSGSREPQRLASVAEAQGLVSFPVKQLTGALNGRELTEVRVVGPEGVVQTYGSGWGTVVLAQGPEREEAPQDEESQDDTGEGGDSAQIPTVDLGGGVEAKELSTPIGTALWWSADGVTYSLKGSVPAAELQEAARGLR